MDAAFDQELQIAHHSVGVREVDGRAARDVMWRTNPENINNILRPGTLRLTGSDGSVVDFALTEGQVIAAPVGTHAVENIGATVVETICIELKGVARGSIAA